MTISILIPGQTGFTSGASSGGDVVGPASSVDKSIPTFSGTTGKLLQDPNGAKIISGAITSPGAGAGSEHFGLGSTSTSANGVAIGKNATAGGASSDGSIAIGKDSLVTGGAIRPGIAIGAGAQSMGGFDSLAIGGAAICNNAGCIIIGSGSQDLGFDGNSLIIGTGALAAGNSIAIGNSALATHVNAVAFGKGAFTTADNQVVFGSGNAFSAIFKDYFFGNGVQNAAPENMSFNATSGTGTDIAGASMTLNAGRPTGAGAGGDIVFQTSAAGGAGTTLRSLAERMRILSTGTVYLPAVSKYNSVTTAGNGVPSIYGYGRATTQSAAAASVATYTVGASDASFEVSANANVTASATHSFSINVDYTDETNTARTLILPIAQLAGSFIAGGLITNVTGTGPYESSVIHIRCKTSTAVTVSTVGTFTSVTYNVEGVIKKIA